MKCLILACLLAVVAPTTFGKLIVGGQESTPHSRPYQAGLFDWPIPEQSYFMCGGTLVHAEWVVSAGHCVFGNEVWVGLGYHDRSKHSEAGNEYIHGTWYRHQQYDAQTLDNDIALIKLDKPVTISTNIKTIGISPTEPTAPLKTLVSGWGTMKSGDFNLPYALREVEVDMIDRASCNAPGAYNGAINNNMVCAGISGGGKDACQGDSGGPFVSGHASGSHNPNTMLRGIVSWGWGCADARYPGVYTNIANYCSWIASTTGNAVTCK